MRSRSASSTSRPKTFVKGGFELPKGKQRVDWENENTLLVAREWKPGDLGRTGYPYIAKRLQRGKPLSSAVEVYRGSPKDGGYGVTPYVLRDSQNRTLSLVDRPLDTFRSETYVLGAKGARRLAIPAKAQPVDMVDGRVIIRSQEDWSPAAAASISPPAPCSRSISRSSRPIPAHLKPTLIYKPGPREALAGRGRGQGRAARLDPRQCPRPHPASTGPAPNGSWTRSRARAARQFDDRHRRHQPHRQPGAADRHQLPDAAVAVAGRREQRAARSEIMRQPAKFDASNLVAEQREATSSDGTKIPYFLVHRRDIKLDGNNPTLLYAYGGFEVSQTPTYSATTGKLWLENGGVYALANIRGGGEFGPAWHEAGLGDQAADHLRRFRRRREGPDRHAR